MVLNGEDVVGYILRAARNDTGFMFQNLQHAKPFNQDAPAAAAAAAARWSLLLSIEGRCQRRGECISISLGRCETFRVDVIDSGN
jgi:hypothetical protein